MALAGLLPLEPDQIGEFMQRREHEGFQAAHHSPVYRRVYRPAYRVISADRAAVHGWCGETPQRSNVQR